MPIAFKDNVLQKGIFSLPPNDTFDIDKGGQITLPVEAGGHEIGNHALIDIRPAGDLAENPAARLPDVVLEFRTRFPGIEFLAARAHGNRVVARR
jgi:hypothetical protein